MSFSLSVSHDFPSDLVVWSKLVSSEIRKAVFRKSGQVILVDQNSLDCLQEQRQWRQQSSARAVLTRTADSSSVANTLRIL
jgi:hypothetical protein